MTREELAREFRRLALESFRLKLAWETDNYDDGNRELGAMFYQAQSQAFGQAAQMVEGMEEK